MTTHEVLHGNADNILCSLESESVDLIFADPPFNLGLDYGEGFNDALTENEYMEWMEHWINECVRLMKPNGALLIHNIPKWLVKTSAILEAMPAIQFRHWIAWQASGNGSRSTGGGLYPEHYGILYYAKPAHVFHPVRYPHHRCRVCGELRADYGGKSAKAHAYGPLCGDVWTDLHRVKHRRVAHPCQLPVPLLERVILMASHEGDMILDPFLGSGTTLIAAKRLGRVGMGIEQSEVFCSLARTRIADAVPQRTLLGGCFVGEGTHGKWSTVRNEDCEALGY